MHTRLTVLAGLVNGIMKFRGHPEEKILLTKTLSATLGTYLDTWAKHRNELDRMEERTTSDDLSSPPPGDFPELTGDAEVDAEAIAKWMGAPKADRVKADFDIDAAALFENDIQAGEDVFQ